MKKNLFYAVFMTMFMTACNFSSTILVTPATKTLPAEGGEFTVSVTTDVETSEWTAECDSTWLHMDKTSGVGSDKVAVTVDANPYATTQSTTIRFRDDKNLVQVIVMREGGDGSGDKPSQNPKAPVKVDITEIQSPADGGTYDVQVTADADLKWSVSSNASWVRSNIGVEKGNKKITLTVDAAPTTTYDPTEAVVTLKPQTSTSDDEKTYIYITRAGQPAPVFTIDKGKKVMFAPGNLQYSPAGNMWRFAEHQYTIIGEDNKYISATGFDYIDLFGWGTSGYNECYPYLFADDAKYGPTGEHDIEGTEYDWGVYNSDKIENSPNKNYKWFTLSSMDWNYILEHNVTTLGKFNGVEGLFVFPDGWEKISTMTFSNYTSFSYSLANENVVTENGVLFLPNAGYRNNKNYGTGVFGRYWTSTVYQANGAGIIEFSSSNDGGDGDVYTLGDPNIRSTGLPVRLAREVNY